MTLRELPWSTCLLALALVSGCPSEDDDPDDCIDDVAGEWESSDEFACPLVDPTCTYRHELTFDGASYEWYPGDQTYEGPFSCHAGEVEALDADGAVVFTGTYDVEADTLELSWEGLSAPEPYRRKTP